MKINIENMKMRSAAEAKPVNKIVNWQGHQVDPNLAKYPLADGSRSQKGVSDSFGLKSLEMWTIVLIISLPLK